MDLFKACNQWAKRPADERFWTVQDMAEACRAYATNSVEANVRFGELRVEARDEEIFLLGKENIPAQLTHYSFGQVAGRVKAPANYLRSLPPTLAAQNINYGLKYCRKADDEAQLLLHQNGGFLARCFTSDRYQRIWNWEIARQLETLQDNGWRVPPARPPHGYTGQTRPATEADVLQSSKFGLSVNIGDIIAPAGVYASDRDMFVFMIDDQRTINNPASPGVPLARGFFIWNSEVGDKSFGVMTFLYDHVCGNHIVWGVQDVKEFRVVHMGKARYKAFGRLQAQLKHYSDLSTSEDEAKILKCQTFEIAKTKEEMLSELMKYINKRRIQLSENNVVDAITAAEQDERYGNPRTPWAIAQGVTVVSQRSEHANKRVQMDKAAGKLLEIAF